MGRRLTGCDLLEDAGEQAIGRLDSLKKVDKPTLCALEMADEVVFAGLGFRLFLLNPALDLLDHALNPALDLLDHALVRLP